jgi:single-strand DNA-binding protein
MGRIQTGSYKNRDGVTVYTTDVVADRVEFLGSGNGEGRQGGSYQGGGRDTFASREPGFGGMTQDTGFSAPQEPFTGFDDMPDTFQSAEDDIPF